MYKALEPILEIQDLDMKMVRLMRVKTERQKEMANLNRIKSELKLQSNNKDNEITTIKQNIRLLEGEIKDLVETIKNLEKKQSSIKKVEEFNALTQQMSSAEKERHVKELRLSDLHDRLSAEEEIAKTLTKTMDQTEENSQVMIDEITESIRQINEEGKTLQAERERLVTNADPEVFRVYERLLRNKKDRVIVPIENRCCSGCHIMVTAQDENLVRKGERLVFCEHCSRVHYWIESKEVEGTAITTKRRRRTTAKAAV